MMGIQQCMSALATISIKQTCCCFCMFCEVADVKSSGRPNTALELDSTLDVSR